jgi:hypothetical protein
MNIENLTPLALIGAHLFTQQDKKSYCAPLNCIQVNPAPNGEGAYLVGMDGHSLVLILDRGVRWEAPLAPCCLKLDNQIITALKDKKLRNVSIKGDRLELYAVGNLESPSSVILGAVEREEQNYPGWRGIVQTGQRCALTTTHLSPSRLGRFEKLLPKGKVALRLDFTISEYGPIFVFPGSGDEYLELPFFGIIMPMDAGAENNVLSFKLSDLDKAESLETAKQLFPSTFYNHHGFDFQETKVIGWTSAVQLPDWFV